MSLKLKGIQKLALRGATTVLAFLFIFCAGGGAAFGAWLRRLRASESQRSQWTTKGGGGEGRREGKHTKSTLRLRPLTIRRAACVLGYCDCYCCRRSDPIRPALRLGLAWLGSMVAHSLRASIHSVGNYKSARRRCSWHH